MNESKIEAKTPTYIPTPRTDEECRKHIYVRIDFARQLERDLSTALNQLRQAMEALQESMECAQAIHRCINDERWTTPKDPLWVPTIHAHATVIFEDCSRALTTSAPKETP